MMIDKNKFVVILSFFDQVELDKGLIWRVLCESITKKGKA